MITKEMIEKRIENCRKRIEEIIDDETNYKERYIMYEDALKNIRYWQELKRAYISLLNDLDKEVKK